MFESICSFRFVWKKYVSVGCYAPLFKSQNSTSDMWPVFWVWFSFLVIFNILMLQLCNLCSFYAFWAEKTLKQLCYPSLIGCLPSSSTRAVSTASADSSLCLEHPCTAHFAFRGTNHPCKAGTVYTRVRNAVTFRSWKLLQVNLTNSHLVTNRTDFAFSFLPLLAVTTCWK